MPAKTVKTAFQLTDTQLVILSGAAQRANRRVLPPPTSLRTKGAALERVLASLLCRSLIAEEQAAPDDASWRSGGNGERMALVLTDAGFGALGIAPTAEEPANADRAPRQKKDQAPARTAKRGSAKEPAANVPPNPFRSGTKGATITALLTRPDGASLAEMIEATGWQAHSVRGFLSGALGRKHGLTVTSATEDGVRRYRLEGREG